jgi:hypothetical protein
MGGKYRRYAMHVFMPDDRPIESPEDLPPEAIVRFSGPLEANPLGGVDSIRSLVRHDVDPASLGIDPARFLAASPHALAEAGRICGLYAVSRDAPVNTIGAITGKTAEQASRAKDMGRKSLANLREALRRLGLCLKGDPPVPRFRVVEVDPVTGPRMIISGVQEHAARERAKREAQQLARVQRRYVDEFTDGYRVGPVSFLIQPT